MAALHSIPPRGPSFMNQQLLPSAAIPSKSRPLLSPKDHFVDSQDQEAMSNLENIPSFSRQIVPLAGSCMRKSQSKPAPTTSLSSSILVGRSARLFAARTNQIPETPVILRARVIHLRQETPRSGPLTRKPVFHASIGNKVVVSDTSNRHKCMEQVSNGGSQDKVKAVWQAVFVR
ncbi:unnamed protein product [Protopolystoma xenopodis]|uniref:Uncharacterized protein n=1 Tax=Protopolystoma xenopodis TaxID=117903 RepID=A0A448XSM4_9PLAT|nr:unnamed protein product [Protopolystoma xenopodis]